MSLVPDWLLAWGFSLWQIFPLQSWVGRVPLRKVLTRSLENSHFSRLVSDAVEIESPIHLTPVPDSQHQHDQLVVVYVVDNTEVTNPNTEFSVTTFELDACRRSRRLS